jgi:hypothetical protein
MYVTGYEDPDVVQAVLLSRNSETLPSFYITVHQTQELCAQVLPVFDSLGISGHFSC